MGRIRTIKPEFSQSESIGRLSRDARLLFILLWTLVDDDGRSRAPSRLLANNLYPYDDDAVNLIDGWLEELDREKMVRRYEVDGSKYLEVVNFNKHQKIDHRGKSRMPPSPAFVEQSRATDEASQDFASTQRRLAPDLGPRTSIKTSTKDMDQDQNQMTSKTNLTLDSREDWSDGPLVRPLQGGPVASKRKTFNETEIPTRNQIRTVLGNNYDGMTLTAIDTSGLDKVKDALIVANGDQQILRSTLAELASAYT